ncbi:xanthine dehydrogenase family protein molybdopterin-binding subunit [Thiohalomonas denitrificans]|uniref:Isoquinoline 1-oxidoreductase, beta subunit n=1 Tax=Thiohalomonas denitrificans TaxID=415747 RepID=A0A1G5PUE8_9GAMM|nr:xanthine dehydrogenase family protein molybdopterin-binding subunit [Thiohalomonas denitrificans]SCZ53052.1 isoquinoline 1-oxidoreductase, beta subunit [Thiohalomonas denitrificans]
MRITRRHFLTASIAATGGILIGCDLNGTPTVQGATNGIEFVPNAWVRIDPDGRITAIVGSSEMGQGVMTAIPMLLAEELEAEWSSIRAEFAPADKAYTNPVIGQQLTGGSAAVRGFWQPVREAGAAARMMLITAAAERWGVDESTCNAEKGEVVHPDSGRRAGYGELAEAAARLPVPESVFLKEPDEFRILGTSRARLDTPQKVDGSAIFAQDFYKPGMLTASVVRCPVFGGKVGKLDASAASAIPGVKEVVNLGDRVAVLAEGFWPAWQGRDALEIVWDEGDNSGLSSKSISRRFREALDEGESLRSEGDPEAAFERAEQVIEATYEVPYLAHACMEPMSCAAEVREDGCDVWVGTQAQTRTRETASRIAGGLLSRVPGLRQDSVRVHTLFLGGGFGRRSEQDFVADAVELSKRVGRPVKVIWTREDDIRHDYYRPATYNRLRVALDGGGLPAAWSHHSAGPSHGAASNMGGARNLPYSISNLEITYASVDVGVPVGYWRSVGSSQNTYITECFFDEAAAAAGRDAYELRRELLTEHPRHLRVLETAAEKAGWGKSLPNGRAQGIAVVESFGSFVAQVAEVSVKDNKPQVHRVVCVIDCGQTVNPNTIEAQMESGILYGLTAALKGEITLENGRVQQSNFHDYEMLRIDEMPEVEVHIIDSDEAPGGVGEPGTPPIAPAVVNALFALTGKPIRRLPIRL